MTNNLTSNITVKVARAFTRAFQKQRVVTKTINTQCAGQFDPSSGDTVKVKRPHKYKSVRTAAGDITSAGTNTIIAGNASCVVQNYFTVSVPWTNKEEALELDQLEQIVMKPAAEQLAIDLETDFQDYMIKNAGLSIGVPGTVVDAWSDVAGAATLMNAIGVPANDQYYIMNPYTVQNLAGAQGGLYGSDKLIQSAWEKAQIPGTFGGLRALASNSMSTWTSGASADRSGVLNATPTATYLATKDTFTQTLAVSGLTASGTIKAGDIIELAGTGANARSFIHQRTQKTVFGATGAPVKWRCVVTTDATISASGIVSLTVAGPAVWESGGQYNNISAALTAGDVVTVLGATATEFQPNLFYHKDAFTLAFVELPKLFSTDTIIKMDDGVRIRVSKYSDGDANTQKIRFDIVPAYGTFNPFMAGKGFGL